MLALLIGSCHILSILLLWTTTGSINRITQQNMILGVNNKTLTTGNRRIQTLKS